MTRAEIQKGLDDWATWYRNSRQSTRYMENAEKERAGTRPASKSPASRKATT
jgi:hypothetical protein